MSILSKRFTDYVKISSPSEHEAVFAKHITKEAAKMSYKPRRDSFGNIYIDVKGDDKRSGALLLNAHIDTVKHDKPIKPIIKNGIITSDKKTILGADNKAGVAVIMELLKIIKEKPFPHPPIQVIFTVQEETGLKGSKNIRRNWIKAKSGYVLDGGDIDKIYYKAPSQYNLTAYIHGRSAHAGVHPECGINAIKVASEAVAKMKLGRIDFETTANIGIIEGGNATNIVPDKVFVKGEARSHNKAKLKAQLSNMQKALKKACKKHKARLELKIEKIYDSFSMSKNDVIIVKAKSALIRIGKRPILKLTGGGSDANNFNKMGIRTAIIGAGADHVHTSNERIAVSDLNLALKYLLEIIKSYA